MRTGGLAVFALLCVTSLLVGARQLEWSGDAWLTLTASRLPRLAALVLTGVGLSVCGVILQHLVRNKFVEPATSGGLDAAKLGILLSLALVPAASVPVRMLFALVVCFAARAARLADAAPAEHRPGAGTAGPGVCRLADLPVPAPGFAGGLATAL